MPNCQRDGICSNWKTSYLLIVNLIRGATGFGEGSSTTMISLLFFPSIISLLFFLLVLISYFPQSELHQALSIPSLEVLLQLHRPDGLVIAPPDRLGHPVEMLRRCLSLENCTRCSI